MTAARSDSAASPGRADRTIIEAAEQASAKRIVTRTRGHPVTRRVMLSRSAGRFVRTAAQHVMTTCKVEKAMKTILLATDFGPCSQEALRHAFGLAAATAAKVHVVHAFTVTRIAGGPERALDALEDARERAERRMRDLVMPWRGSGLLGEVIVQMGHPKHVILSTAQKLGADLIILGRHRRRGLRRRWFGGLAEAVMRRTDASLLVAPSLRTSDEADEDCESGRPSIDEATCD